jgi:hypothetical protein
MIVDIMTGLTIPDSWCLLLKELQQNDPTAILAGGAIRDLYCGRKPIKDLDFFCKDTSACFDNKEWISGGRPIEYTGMEYVCGIAWFPNAKPLPCNVIYGEEYESTTQLLESFDFGLCQIAFDGLNIIKTWAFDWDWKHAVMTMRLTARHAGRRDLSLKRFERWREKYPEFSLVEVIETAPEKKSLDDLEF